MNNYTAFEKSIRTCEYYYECPDHSKCYENICICKQGYITTILQPNVCAPIECHFDKDCKKYDENSHCKSNACHCTGSLTWNTQRCNPIINQYNLSPKCNTTNDCSSNSVCSSGRCLCYSGYNRTVKYPQYCLRMACNSNSDCIQHDSNSHCHNGDCVCDSGFEENKIYCQVKEFHLSYFAALRWVCLTIGVILGFFWFLYKNCTCGIQPPVDQDIPMEGTLRQNSILK